MRRCICRTKEPALSRRVGEGWRSVDGTLMRPVAPFLPGQAAALGHFETRSWLDNAVALYINATPDASAGLTKDSEVLPVSAPDAGKPMSRRGRHATSIYYTRIAGNTLASSYCPNLLLQK